MRSRRWAPLCCALLVAGFLADLTVRPGGVHLTRTIDDIAEMLAAAAAAATGLWRARHSLHRTRTSWALIGLGAGGWAVGEGIWCYYELIAGRDTPFPSLADAGFLVFPVLGLAGLLVRPSAAFAGQGRVRVALDAVLVAASLFIVSWGTALGEVYRAGADSTFAAVVSLAYPGTDLVLLTVTVVVASYARTGARVGLWWITAGLVALAVGDSGFAYLTAAGHYGQVNLVDAGWVAGFLILAVAALVDDVADDPTDRPIAPRFALLMPYLPATAAILVLLHLVGTHQLLDTALITGGVFLVAALIGRQMIVLLENRALMSRISHQAFHDVLTGLANRALFSDRLEHALDLHRRDLRAIAVLLIDIDDFKTVNDSLGHPAGDELLIRISERLCASVRTGDTVARLGGDEFAVLLEDGGDAFDVAARLLSGFDLPMTLCGRELPVRASIGVSFLAPADPPADGTEMLKRADVATYAAKRAGKGTVMAYSAALAGGDEDQLDLHTALVTDVTTGRIDVAFQPIRLADGTLRGFEALARWSKGGEVVSPAVFIPLARRLGLLPALDGVVVRRAVAEAARWPQEIVLSVNLAAESLGDPALPARVSQALADAGVAAERLSIEVLESSVIEQDHRALTSVRALRAIGVRVAVDDFGAGYASLARLRALEPDVIKVDRSLLAAETDPERPSALLVGVIDLAHRLGAMVVAEGVETPVQLAAALAAGCDAVQGFLWGVPTTADECRRLIDTSTGTVGGGVRPLASDRAGQRVE
ncbi:MAG TPA: EAL domain-containing protein [Mycobacteriales bacterium]|nr:EAL domain-containing protein [Mycobacteriales bacterium]